MDKKQPFFIILFILLFLGVVTVIIVCFIAKYGHSYDNVHVKRALPWWKETAVYQAYPRSIYDGDPDGTGDIKGITSKADYFVDLGIGAVWLSPIYTSPMADFGYDIANFTDIDPIFGTMADFDDLLRSFHDKGLKVIMDFVPNHSSDEHEWFIKSVKKEDPYTNYYIWADPKGFNETGGPIPPSNWLSVFRGSAWTWVEERQQFYLHQFLYKQPDLNYRYAAVREEMANAIRFWLDKGVDGIRVDALKFLFEVEDLYEDEPVAGNSEIDDPLDYYYLNHTLTINQPETFEVLREWRQLIDEYSDKLLMVEVYDDSVQEVMKYYGNDTVPLADFPFNFFMIDRLHNRTDLTGESIKATIDLWLDNMPEGKWPNWVLGNHDNARVGTRFGDDLVDALNMMSLLLPGTSTTYFGEEIGMVNTWISWEDTQDPQGCNYGPEHYAEHSRDPERTPLQWDDSVFAGFTAYNDTWLPVNENYVTLNVKAQQEAEFSHLKVFQSLAQLRKEEVFLSGNLAYPVITEDIFSFVRYTVGAEMYLLVINTSEKDIVVNLHHSASFQLPETGAVVIRSVSDTSEETRPGSVVSLDSVPMVGGEGLVFSLGVL